MSNRNIYICVTPFFPSPQHWQGAYVLDQIKAIQRNSNFEVIVFKSCTINDKQDNYEFDGIKVYTFCPLLMPSYFMNGLTEGIVSRMFVRMLTQMNIDISKIAFVHCHTTNHAAFGFGIKHVDPRVKVILQFHDLDPLTLRNGLWANLRWNRRYRAKKSVSVLNRADALICISEPVRDVILSFPYPRKGEVFKSALDVYQDLEGMPSICPKNIYVLNNGVDTTLFQKRKSIRNDSCFRIGCIANFTDVKDHMTLIKAFCRLVHKGYTQFRLSLLGSGETKQQIIHYVEENGLTDYVEWPDEVFHYKLPDYYKTLDLFVLPSVFEGFGCVYTEAYACGVPFIGCYNQGAAECIALDSRDRWLIEPHDVEGLVERIESFYLNRPDQKLCKSYDIDILITDYLRYIENL